MKKNKWMRLASIMLVLCLLTTTVIAGTFAKYISSDSAEDSARVAKWGVAATAYGDLFGASYLDKAQGNKITTWSKNTETVSASENVKVVAPGTVGNELHLRVQGIPEVSAQVLFGEALDANGQDANLANSDVTLAEGMYGVFFSGLSTGLTDDNIAGLYTYDGDKYVKVQDGDAYVDGETYFELQDVVKAKDYHPLKYSLTDFDAGNELTDVTLAKVLTEVANGAQNLTFVPNELVNFHATMTWKWEFEVDKPDDSIYAKFDKEDTILGDMIFEALNVGGPDKYTVVYMPAGEDEAYPVKYKEVPVADGSNNTVWVAWYETEPKFAYEKEILPGSEGVLAKGVLAVLGAAVNVSVTAVQID